MNTDPVPEPADDAEDDDLTLNGIDVSGRTEPPVVPPVPPLHVEPLDTGLASEPGHAVDHEFEWDLIERAGEPTEPTGEPDEVEELGDAEPVDDEPPEPGTPP